MFNWVKGCVLSYFAENKENNQIKIHINDQTKMEIVTQDVDDEKSSEKIMLETDKNNSAIEANQDSMETEDQKSEEILDPGKGSYINDVRLFWVIFDPSPP